MTERETDVDDDAAAEPVTTGSLFAAAAHRLRRDPRVVGAFLVVGVLAAVVDVVRRGDPVPTASFVGVQEGTVSLRFGLLVDVIFRHPTPVTALPELRPRWFAWTVGLELVRGGALVVASVYAYARLLDETATVGSVARYAVVAFAFALVGVSADVGLVLGLPLGVLVVYLLVRFAPVSGLLATGASIPGAFRAGWRSTGGHGWTLFGVVLVVGLSNHLLGSVPLVGPVGSSLAAVVHVAVIAVFLDRTRADERGR